MSENNNMSIHKVVEIIKSVLGPHYKFTIGGFDSDIIYIENTISGKKNSEFRYKDSINYGSLPWVIRKSLEYREHIGINATSERYCFNPNEDGIQSFVKLCFNLD